MTHEADGGPALGPIATRVLYEDDQVRVWDQLIEPGATTGPHRHDLPYALVTVDGTTLDVEPVAGFADRHGQGATTVTLESRTVMMLDAGAVEEARNPSDHAYRAILVEFKSR